MQYPDGAMYRCFSYLANDLCTVVYETHIPLVLMLVLCCLRVSKLAPNDYSDYDDRCAKICNNKRSCIEDMWVLRSALSGKTVMEFSD